MSGRAFESEFAASLRPGRAGALPEEDRSEVEANTARALAAGETDALSPASMLHLQRTAGNASVAALVGEEAEERGAVHDVVGKSGTPMDRETRSVMEQRFGQEFGDVRVHADAAGGRAAESVAANAFTVGNDVAFRSGAYQPGTPAGQRMIAHELTHVVQQRSGPVAGAPAPGGIKLSDPGDAFERAADQNADRVMAGQSSVTAPAGAEASAVQRDEDELALQGSFVQREMPEDEEELQK